MRDEDIEEAARNRIASAFAPVVREESATRVLAGAHRIVHQRQARRRQILLSVSAAAVLAVSLAVSYPLVVSYLPGQAPRIDPAPGSGQAGIHSLPLVRGGMGGLLARPGVRRNDLADAREHLGFEPALPNEVSGQGPLESVYTFSELDATWTADGTDTSFVASYKGGLTVVEKQWDETLVRDDAAFIHMLNSYPSRQGSRLIRSAGVGEVSVTLWMSPPKNERDRSPKSRRIDAAWFAAGIGYIISSDSLAPEQLLGMAERMIR